MLVRCHRQQALNPLKGSGDTERGSRRCCSVAMKQTTPATIGRRLYGDISGNGPAPTRRKVPSKLLKFIHCAGQGWESQNSKGKRSYLHLTRKKGWVGDADILLDTAADTTGAVHTECPLIRQYICIRVCTSICVYASSSNSQSQQEDRNQPATPSTWEDWLPKSIRRTLACVCTIGGLITTGTSFGGLPERADARKNTQALFERSQGCGGAGARRRGHIQEQECADGKGAYYHPLDALALQIHQP